MAGFRFARSFLLVAGAIFVVSSPAVVVATEATSAVSDRKADLKTVVIPIEGMACVACAATVRKTLKSLDGVSSVEVNLEKRSAQVTFAASKLSPDALVAAINKLGYRAGTPKGVE